MSILNQEDLIAQIKSSKDRNSYKNVVVDLIRDHEETLSTKLSDEIKQHNMNFTLLLDKFKETNYAKGYSPELKKKKKTQSSVQNNVETVEIKGERDKKEKKKVRFLTDTGKKSTFDGLLPVYVQILLQSNKFACKDTFDIKDIPNSLYELTKKQIYNCTFSKQHLTVSQQSSIDDLGKEMTHKIQSTIFEGVLTDISSTSNPLDYITNYLECLSLLIRNSNIYLINVEIWESSLDKFFSLPYKTDTSDEDFCNTQMFEIMSKTWFPWCTHNSQFLTMLKISKLLKILDPSWYYSIFKNQPHTHLYCTTYKCDIRVFNSWRKLCALDCLNIILLMKHVKNYVVDDNIFNCIDYTNANVNIYIFSCKLKIIIHNFHL